MTKENRMRLYKHFVNTGQTERAEQAKKALVARGELEEPTENSKKSK